MLRKAYGVDKGPVYEDGNEDDGHVFSRIRKDHDGDVTYVMLMVAKMQRNTATGMMVVSVIASMMKSDDDDDDDDNKGAVDGAEEE